MKKHVLLAATLFGCLSMAHATVHTISVANFQFSDATVNAIAGDTIVWNWVEGNHTTTSKTIPAGAAAWDVLMNESSTSFTYKLTVAGTYDYICKPHAAFGMVGTINVSSVLPVTLLNFTATVTPENKALLKWTVATEQNVSYYAIQKSTDGKTFMEAGRVNAGATSSIQKTYSYTDDNANSRYIYYSLEIVDRDGKTQLSPIALYKNDKIKGGIIAKISPNPISSPGHLMLQFNADKPGTLLVELYDMNGRRITQTNMMADAGVNNGHFHLGELPAGIYTVVFSIDGKKEMRRLQFE